MCDIRPMEMSVQQVAALAKLSLSEEAESRLQSELNDMLTFAQALQTVDTTGVQPTLHVVPVKNVLREDIPAPSTPRELLMQNAPAVVDGYVAVPKTFD